MISGGVRGHDDVERELRFRRLPRWDGLAAKRAIERIRREIRSVGPHDRTEFVDRYLVEESRIVSERLKDRTEQVRGKVDLARRSILEPNSDAKLTGCRHEGRAHTGPFY